jgi:hypothetical protein
MRGPRGSGSPPIPGSTSRSLCHASAGAIPALAILVTLAAAGCGGGGASASIPIDDLVARMQAAVCHQGVACGVAPDTATCNASIFVVTETPILTVVASVKRGTTRYDGELARQCLDRIASLPCPSEPPNLGLCDGVFQGTVAAGGACVTGEECISQACVSSSGCQSASCQGTCAPGLGLVTLGAACDGVGTFCSDDAYCKSGVCVALIPAGSPCGGTDDVCVAGHSCQASGSAGTTVCMPNFPAEGATCTPGRACQRSDDYCDATSLECVRRKLPGAACDGDQCVGYAHCVNGACTPIPGPGASCFDASGNPILNCLGDLICVGEVCGAPPPIQACVP